VSHVNRLDYSLCYGRSLAVIYEEVKIYRYIRFLNTELCILTIIRHNPWIFEEYEAIY
jgi:hypothetical protein